MMGAQGERKEDVRNMSSEDLSGDPRFSATDLVDFLSCPRKLLLNREHREGLAERPVRDAMGQFLADQGLQHEQRVRDALAAQHPDLTAIGGGGPRQRIAETLDAMRRGVSVIDQGELSAGPWVGRPDFLMRVDSEEAPSRFGPYHYEPLDAKLSKRARGEAVTQLAFYSLLLEDVQGVSPRHMHIALGGDRTVALSTQDFSSYLKSAQGRLVEWIDTQPASAAVYPEPVSACQHCDWRPACDEVRRRDDHVALAGGAGAVEVATLHAANVDTLAKLATLAEGAHVPGIGPHALARLSRQARLQLRQHDEPGLHCEVLPDAERGFRMLPPATDGDLYLSIQSDGLATGGPLAYLWGWIEGGGGTQAAWNFGWAHDRAKEREALMTWVDQVQALAAAQPTMHVYHYGSAARQLLAALMARTATRQRELDALLRAGVFVDLYQVLRRSVQLAVEEYGLPQVEAFYADLVPPRAAGTIEGSMTAVYYHRWEDSGEQRWLTELERYNEAECRSLMGLHAWLGALAAQHQGTPAYEGVQEGAAETQLPEIDRLLGSTNPGHQLLGHLLQYHWREERTVRADLAARKRSTPEELFDDSESIANLTWVASEPGGVDVYQFDPAQPFKLTAGSKVADPSTGQQLGDLVHVDPEEGVVKLPRPLWAPHPQHLVPNLVIAAPSIVSALERLAHALAGGTGLYQAARHLLYREAPDFRTATLAAGGAVPADSLVRGAERLALDLDRSYLAVQGPPGTGKTYLAAHVIVQLVEAGHTVGVMGPSHKVIGNLLQAVGGAAPPHLVSGLQKISSGVDPVKVPGIRPTTTNGSIESAVRRRQANLVAGTAWLFVSEALDQQLDYLVIDEAGQVPLANALAAATAAQNLILVGDPQQLRQPRVTVHPMESDASALSHLLDGQEVMPADRGLFLGQTRRMHPAITRFVANLAYQGRLAALPGLELQHIRVAGADAAGLWHVPVSGPLANDSASPEEAAAVLALVSALAGGEWVDQTGKAHPLTLDDILVVAPFNRQVNLLTHVLPAGSRVGTVDKFQGQEAPVVIYSTAAADGERAPHGEEFLLNINRLNVAISRARALAVLVAHPRLLASRPLDPEPLRVVNALCALAEQASPLPAALARAVDAAARQPRT